MEISEVDHLRGRRASRRISPREVELIKFRDNRTALVVTLLKRRNPGRRDPLV